MSQLLVGMCVLDEMLLLCRVDLLRAWCLEVIGRRDEARVSEVANDPTVLLTPITRYKLAQTHVFFAIFFARSAFAPMPGGSKLFVVLPSGA
jgi:hypothetical protein